MPPAVELSGVSRRYGRVLALDDVSFAVAPGEFFALLGPNGAGKTTLLNILCTLLRPHGGSVRIAGHDLMRDPRGARRHLGVVFQEPSLDDRLTVAENLDFHGLVYGVPQPQRRRRIDSLLALVELEARRDAPVRTLSSGMKRRLELARALVHDAAILLLDEPTVGLDVQSREGIWRHVEALRIERGLAVIVSTHLIGEVEGCDRVCIIDGGRVVALDSPAALAAAHGRQTIRFLPRLPADAEAVLAAWPGLAVRRGPEVHVDIPDPGFTADFLARFGNRAEALAFDHQSLESVFLSLTGRQLRDAAASPREQTLAFGRRGGEHTR